MGLWHPTAAENAPPAPNLGGSNTPPELGAGGAHGALSSACARRRRIEVQLLQEVELLTGIARPGRAVAIYLTGVGDCLTKKRVTLSLRSQ